MSKKNTFRDRLAFLLDHYEIRVMTLDAKAGLYHGQTGSFLRGDTEPKLSTIVKLVNFSKTFPLTGWSSEKVSLSKSKKDFYEHAIGHVKP